MVFIEYDIQTMKLRKDKRYNIYVYIITIYKFIYIYIYIYIYIIYYIYIYAYIVYIICNIMRPGFSGARPCVFVTLIKLQSSIVEIALLCGCSPVGSLCVCRRSFLENTSEGLLLNTHKFIYDF